MHRKYSWTSETHEASFPNSALLDGKRRLSFMTEKLSEQLARRSKSLDLGAGRNQLYGPDKPDTPAVNMHSIRPLLLKRADELRYGSLNVKARYGIIEETPYVKLSELIQQNAQKTWNETLQYLQSKQPAKKKCLILRERPQKSQALDISFNPLTFSCQKSTEQSSRRQKKGPTVAKQESAKRSRRSNRENNIFFSKSTLMSAGETSKCCCGARKASESGQPARKSLVKIH